MIAKNSFVSDFPGDLEPKMISSTYRPLKQPVVFLDRDGTINENRLSHVLTWDDFVFRPGVAEAIRNLKEAHFAVVVITNQAAIGRGILSETNLQEIHARMCSQLAEQGAWINKVYYCPHHPDDNCGCRKPMPGLIKQAFSELSLDNHSAYLVGDHVTDIAAGRAAGLVTILVDGGRGTINECGLHTPDIFVPDLPSAADWILDHYWKQ